MGIKNPIAPCICCYITFETLMLAKQAINDKLQGSVAMYFFVVGLSITKLRKVYC